MVRFLFLAFPFLVYHSSFPWYTPIRLSDAILPAPVRSHSLHMVRDSSPESQEKNELSKIRIWAAVKRRYYGIVKQSDLDLKRINEMSLSIRRQHG